MAELVVLNSEQLRKLAKIIYYQEAEAIKNIIFKSEPELAEYLRDSKANYESAVGLLDAGSDLRSRFANDGTRAPIAQDIFDFIANGANFALQIVRNCTLRMNYLSKIREHAGAVMDALKTLDTGNEINVRRLAKEAVQYRNAMLEYTRKHQSPASRHFSKWLKESGIKFDELVQRYQVKLKFEGPFKDLEDAQKIQVYEEIMEASGRGRVIVNRLSKVFGVAGIALLLVTVGLMVWDIFSSEHIIQTATRDAVVAAASVGGAILGEVVGVAIISTQLVGVEASALFVMMAGLITSFLGAFLLGAFAGWLVDLILGTGGAAHFSTEGHRCYVAPMPDGQELARQIQHEEKLTNQAPEFLATSS